MRKNIISSHSHHLFVEEFSAASFRAEFFPAEEYHQDYVKNNPTEGYVVQQALPKVAKAKKAAAELSGTTQPSK